MPKVSVVIPNYNHESFLEKRIESILNQTYQDFELIILDDCSTDNSGQIIEKYRRIDKVSQIVYNEKNSGGPFGQWEKGLDLAIGEWVWIAESDDYADPEFLQTLLNLTRQHEHVGIAMSHSHKVDGGELKELHDYMDGSFSVGVKEVRERLCHFNIITNVSACLLNRKIAINAISGLSKFKTCGDWIFYTRILQHSNLAYSPQKLNYYRWHANNISTTACKTSSYVTEGINVLKDIDFNLVHFSVMGFLALGKGWLNKVKYVKFKDSFKPMTIIATTTLRFIATKITPKPFIEYDDAYSYIHTNDDTF